ncbi:MAG: hypothetical protein DME22_17315 [Verrucomicrobia bacterium]|nr:MAG: hypothetical protein DME22_17315 [Verrucomicrobiota bacterium]
MKASKSQPPRTAKYLLRFDDLCPTMNWKLWSEIEAALTEHQLQPILAVVPDNQDPVLNVAPAVKDFWERVRQWQARGWTIGLHGFQHKYVATHAGIGTVRKKTEFAGLRAEEQSEKLRRGVEIFERQGIKSRVWIAPNNSFDATTVRLLSRFGIDIICDGNFRFPYVCPLTPSLSPSDGETVRERGWMTWVPQQLSCLRLAPPGVWTVCYHHNRWTAASLGFPLRQPAPLSIFDPLPVETMEFLEVADGSNANLREKCFELSNRVSCRDYYVWDCWILGAVE